MLCLLAAFAGKIRLTFMLVWNAEHNDRTGAYDTPNASVEGLEMGDTGVVPPVRAAFHQVLSAAVASTDTSA